MKIFLAMIICIISARTVFATVELPDNLSCRVNYDAHKGTFTKYVGRDLYFAGLVDDFGKSQKMWNSIDVSNRKITGTILQREIYDMSNRAFFCGEDFASNKKYEYRFYEMAGYAGLVACYQCNELN